MFQSSLRPKAERNILCIAKLRGDLTVSILAPPEGGAQRVPASFMFSFSSFNPRSARRRSATVFDMMIMRAVQFQSSLRPKAERNSQHARIPWIAAIVFEWNKTQVCFFKFRGPFQFARYSSELVKHLFSQGTRFPGHVPLPNKHLRSNVTRRRRNINVFWC
jgi:hypothetical protein